jgi:hypothetical protein
MAKIKCLMLVVLCLSFAACAELALVGTGAAVGIAVYKYYEGYLTVVYEAPFTDTWDATLKAVKKMNLEIWSSDRDLTSGKITACCIDEKQVAISLVYKSANETEVVIRTGYLGDEEASMAVKERIREVLFEE